MDDMNSRPRLREKGPPALPAQQNSPLNKLRLLPANYPERHERRAPKLLHVGRRIPAIQGRRVGEWHGKHRVVPSGARVSEASSGRAAASTSRCEVDGGRSRSIRDRLAGRTPRPERGGRGSSPCSGASRASSSIAQSACLTHKMLLVRVQPRPSHVVVAQR
jgi:hypothetical protein